MLYPFHFPYPSTNRRIIQRNTVVYAWNMAVLYLDGPDLYLDGPYLYLDEPDLYLDALDLYLDGLDLYLYVVY